MTVDASPSPEPGREGSLGDAFLPSGLRRIERSPAGGQSRQTAAGQSTGLSGAPPAVGIPNTPPGPRRLHRSVSPHGCAMRHTPPHGNTRSSSPRGTTGPTSRHAPGAQPTPTAHLMREVGRQIRDAAVAAAAQGPPAGPCCFSWALGPRSAPRRGWAPHLEDRFTASCPLGLRAWGSHLSGGYRGRHRPRHQILRQQEAAAQTCGIWDALPPTLKGAARFPFDSQHQMTPARVFSADPVA